MSDERETQAREALHLDQPRPDLQESQTGEGREPGGPDAEVGHSDVPDPEAREAGTEERHGAALASEHGHAIDTHEAAAHGAGEGHGEHEQEERLGPIDWTAWGASALGLAVGVVVAVFFAIAATG